MLELHVCDGWRVSRVAINIGSGNQDEFLMTVNLVEHMKSFSTWGRWIIVEV